MKKKNILAALLTCFLATGFVACTNPTTNTDDSKPDVEQSSSEKEDETSSSAQESNSPIKELVALSESVDLSIGTETAFTSFYKITGFKSLTAKQKRVTVTSSNPEVVKINTNTLTAVALGNATITVVSQADETKTCSFTINVTDCFFDRSITSISSTWDVSNEMAEVNPSIKVDTDLGNGIYIRGSEGIKWFVETEITIHEVASSEAWPKFGIVANTETFTTDTNNNKVYFFLNAEMLKENNWVDYGVCEVSNGSSWAWNAGVGNNVARHSDNIYVSSNPVGYNQAFKLGMLRDGFNLHFYINGEYVISALILDTIFGNYNEETQSYSTPANAYAGFFSFNSTVTFSNYKFVNDETAVNEMLAAITPTFCEWAED